MPRLDAPNLFPRSIQRAAPRERVNIVPAGLLAAEMAPGAGLLDASGRFPDGEGGFRPSLVQNLRAGRWGDAAGQGVGLLGDALSVLGPAGTAAGTAGKAIFIGATAAGWDRARAAQALAAEKAGMDPREIWETTGTFRSPDGGLRQEIDDSQSRFLTRRMIEARKDEVVQENKDIRARIAAATPKDQPDLFPKELRAAIKPLRERVKANTADLKDLYGYQVGYDPSMTTNYARIAFQHPELYDNYPDLGNIRIRQGEAMGPYLGAASPGMVEVYRAGLARDPRSTVLHEMQHMVQDAERMSPGGNPAQFDPARPEVQQAAANLGLPLTTPNEIQAAQFELYRRLGGEAEARAVQARRDLTPEQRRVIFPLDSYDVHESQVIPWPKQMGLFD